jgi:hypothetical protein
MEAGLGTYVRQPSTDHAHPSQHLIKTPKNGNSRLMFNPLRDALRLIRLHKTEFITVNAAFYGLLQRR